MEDTKIVELKKEPEKVKIKGMCKKCHALCSPFILRDAKYHICFGHLCSDCCGESIEPVINFPERKMDIYNNPEKYDIEYSTIFRLLDLCEFEEKYGIEIPGEENEE